MIDQQAGLQVPQKILNLIDRNGISHTHIHAATLFERTTTIDADQLAGGTKQRPAGVAGVDGSVDLNAVGIFQQRA